MADSTGLINGSMPGSIDFNSINTGTLAGVDPSLSKLPTLQNGIQYQSYSSGTSPTDVRNNIATQQANAQLANAWGTGTVQNNGPMALPGQQPVGSSYSGVNVSTPGWSTSVDMSGLTPVAMNALQSSLQMNPNQSKDEFMSQVGSYLKDLSGPASGTGAAPAASGPSFGSTNPTAGVWNPVTRQVDPAELTSTQLNGLIASNSPYIQQARAQAMITANDRGLVNSSMAAGAGQAAAINAALPIATQNANAYGTVLGANMQAQNQAGSQNAQGQTQASVAGAQNATSLQSTNMNNATQLGVAGINAKTAIQTTGMNNATTLQNTSMNNATALAQTGLSTAAQTAIAGMNNATQVQINSDLNSNRVLLQNSQAATNLANQYALNIANIDASTTMDAAAKAAAIQSQRDIFNQSIAGLTSASPGVPDVSSTLQFGSPTPAPTPAPTQEPQSS